MSDGPADNTAAVSVSTPYTRYAAIYDQTGQTTFSEAAWRHVRRRLVGFGWAGRDVLDLACGTGAAAVRMAEQGLRVTGADRSREMLTQAAWRAERAGCAVRWVAADMRRLTLAPAAFDLVTAFYDSINYLLSPEDLTATLSGVAQALRPDGLFCFDVNTVHCLRTNWSGLCQADAGDDVATIWRARWDEANRISSLTATFFVRGADGRYDRFDEVHDERGFTDREMSRAIRAAGLELVLCEDTRTHRRPRPDSRRLFYFLRRPV